MSAIASNASLSPGLPQNSISVVLFSRGDGKFHWALGLATDGRMYTFRKLHATQLNGPGWEFEDVEHDIVALQARKPVCAIVQIGNAGFTDSPNKVAELVRTITMDVPEQDAQKEPIFTCRVWLRQAVRVLHNNGVLYCPNVDALEKELVALGDTQY